MSLIQGTSSHLGAVEDGERSVGILVAQLQEGVRLAEIAINSYVYRTTNVHSISHGYT